MQNTFASADTNSQAAKQMYKTQPSGRKGRSQIQVCTKVITVAANFELLMLVVNRDGEQTSHYFVPFLANTWL